MEIDTGYISLFTDYKVPSTYGIIYAENDPIHGYIKYHTNVKVIQYNGNEYFTFENGMIDLRNNKYIYYDDGFVIENDFELKLRGMYLNQMATILMKNTKCTITVQSFLYNNGQIRFKLTVPSPLGNYILYSDPINFDDSDMVCVVIRRKNNIYGLDILIEYGFSFENNTWYGRQMPSRPELYDRWIDTDNMETYVVDKDVMHTFTSDEEPSENVNIDDLWLGR